MTTNEILLQGITLEQLKEGLLEAIERRLKESDSNPESLGNEKYLTRKEVAKLLSISLPTLHDWCKKRILNSYRMGNRVYFKSSEIDQSLVQVIPN